MRLKTGAFYLLTLLLPGSSSAEALSRQQVVARALQANPDVKKGLEEIKRLEGLITEARADALPELTGWGTFSRYRDPSLLNSSAFDSFPADLRDELKPVPANLYEGTAQLHQTLFSFKIGHAVRAAGYGRSYGLEALREARQSVSLLAVRTYNDYLLSLERVRIAEQSVRQKEIQLEVARNRRAAGVVTDLDVLRFEVNLENDRATLVREEGGAELARGRLNSVMVQPIESEITPTDSLTYVPFDVPVDDAVREAWSRRPEAKALDLEEKIRRENIGIQAADGKPSLDFNGVYGWSVRDLTNYFNSDFSKWSLGVALKVPLFNGWRTKARVAQATAEVMKLEEDRVALENQIRLDAKDGVERLKAAKKLLDAADLAVNQARRALQMTEESYRLGAASTLDVLDAQASMRLAESNRIQALYDHANARATLRYVMAADPSEDDPRPSGNTGSENSK